MTLREAFADIALALAEERYRSADNEYTLAMMGYDERRQDEAFLVRQAAARLRDRAWDATVDATFDGIGKP